MHSCLAYAVLVITRSSELLVARNNALSLMTVLEHETTLKAVIPSGHPPEEVRCTYGLRLSVRSERE